ncbi:hypothetical protein BABINDRAFT_161475 [Babjeviella inositovora NRRL Y-12698]|uniref:Fumarylacetoacetase-like C-terminal domain-containing protein n=1 Tax=Babjeviella inositovora NRRL Y-12698 TaxID=984486 RepID=A0A1E3QPZ7_9ASCO|nr:uncharacterized protein BABINDRAFT_161475 [Babjeviella inositovora NRRL Y-12698]ODQ79779.1 hypothetical protein BABINDRAFT_161475 [Babjeviella inositovora NRRL Y-12698]
MTFSRLIRFANKGETHYGDAVLTDGITDTRLAKKAHKITGDIYGEYTIDTSETLDIEELLCPLAPKDINTVRLLGLNYAAHAKMAGVEVPKYPILFYKPRTSVCGPNDPIIVPEIARTDPDTNESEAELVIVMGKSGKNLRKESALEYVLGYCIGNDVSQRTWSGERGGGQYSLGKMYDNYAPIGPAIAAPAAFGNPDDTNLKAHVNDSLRQDSSTKDMVFDCAELVSFLSQGCTLLPGDLIFTGTPLELPKFCVSDRLFLKENDIVTLELEGVGTIANKVVYEYNAK